MQTNLPSAYNSQQPSPTFERRLKTAETNLKHLISQTPSYQNLPKVYEVVQPKIEQVSISIPKLEIKQDLPLGGSIYSVLKPLSYSSIWTSKLMCWRNKGDESLGKIIVTELSLPLLTLSALIETVVYNAFYYGAKGVESHQIVDLKESSFFTIRWTSTMVYHNLVMLLLPESESSARKFIKNKLTA